MSTDHIDIPNVAEWHFHAPKQTPSGGAAVYVDRAPGDKRNPSFQLPTMVAPFGISLTDVNGNPVAEHRRCNMELDAVEARVIEVMSMIDQHVVKNAAKNSRLWFKRELTENDLKRMMFRSSIQAKQDSIYNPKLRVKVARGADRRRSTKIYLVSKDNTYTRTLDLSDVTPHSRVCTKVEIGSVWFGQNSFGITLVATEMLVWPHEAESDTPSFRGFENLTAATTNSTTTTKPDPVDPYEALEEEVQTTTRYV